MTDDRKRCHISAGYMGGTPENIVHRNYLKRFSRNFEGTRTLKELELYVLIGRYILNDIFLAIKDTFFICGQFFTGQARVMGYLNE